jgi:hypothetical protein
MLSLEVTASQFKEARELSKYFSTTAEPLEFDNGYFALLEGKSTSFTLKKCGDMIICSCSCEKTTKTTVETTVRTTAGTTVGTTKETTVTTTAITSIEF